MAEITVPVEFFECSDEFRPSVDRQLLHCLNLSRQATPCELLETFHQVIDFRPILSITTLFITLFFNIFYLILQIIVFKRADRSLRKRHVFLLARTVCTIDAALVLIVWLYCVKHSGFVYSTSAAIFFIATLDFFSIVGTFVVLSVLLYLAITRPIFYKTRITMCHCYLSLCLVWLVAAILSGVVALFGSTLFFPKSSPIVCPLNTCFRPIYIVIFFTIAFDYAVVLVVYIVLLLRLRRLAVKNKAMSSSTEGNMKAMKRLGLNVITFSIGNIPILAAQLVMTLNLDTAAQLSMENDICTAFIHARAYRAVETFGTVYAMIWLSGLLVDPIINVGSDPQIRRLLSNWGNFLIRNIHSIRSSVSSGGDKKTEITDCDA